MFKKLAFAGLGVAFLASPILVSAQALTLPTVPANASVEQLQAFVVQLTQLLQQLIAQRSTASGQPAVQITLPSTKATPSCTITTDKDTYVLGDQVNISWKSAGATYGAWRQEGSGKDNFRLDGGKLSTNGQTSFTANVLGNPYVTLNVFDASGVMGTCTKVIPVSNLGSGVTFTASPTSGTAPLWVTFNSTVGGAPLPVPPYTSYKINFGDGVLAQLGATNAPCAGSACLFGVSHTYSSPGTYSAYLSGTNGDTSWPVGVPVTITVGGFVQPQLPVPGTPLRAVATCNATGDSVTLSWFPGVANSSYHLRVNDPSNDSPSCQDGWFCPGSGDIKQDLAANSWTEPTAVPITVVPNKKYEWWVHGGFANQLSAPVKASFTCVPAPTAQLSAPTGLSYSCSSDGTQVSLSWDSLKSAASYYLRVNNTANDTSSCSDGWFCADGTDFKSDGIKQGTYAFMVKPGQVYTWWVHGAQENLIGPATTSKFMCAPDHVAEVTSTSADMSEQLIRERNTSLANALSALESALSAMFGKSR